MAFASFDNSPDTNANAAIRKSMEEMADLVQADRISAFVYDLQSMRASLTSKWQRPGFEAEEGQFTSIPLKDIPDWDVDAHRRGEAIWTPDTQTLPEGTLKAMNLREGIKSTLAVPILEDGTCLGFVQFNWIRQKHTFSGYELSLLNLLSGLVVGSIRGKRNAPTPDIDPRLKSIGQGITEGMIYQVIVRPDGSRKFTYLSDSVRKLHGCSPLEGMEDASKIYSRVHPDDAAYLAKVENDAIRSLSTLRAEFRVQDPSGGMRWSSVTSVPQRLADGSTCWDGMEVVITDRKRVEESLRESEFFFRESQRAGSIGSYKCDFELGFWTSSEVLDQILGITAEHPRTVESWLALVAPEDAPSMARYLQDEVLGAKKSFYREYRIRRPSDGRVRWVLGTGRLSLDARGAVVSMIGTIQDITERKQAEYERERLLTAVEQAGDAIFITDTDGKILYVNPAFERITGFSRSDSLGMTPRILKSGQHDVGHYRELWSTIKGGKTWKGRLINRSKDGHIFTEEATISPVLGSDGAIVNFVAVKHDISEQLRLEAQFLQAQKMESVGRLAGGVAHDFNNMLSVIIGLTELELTKMVPESPLHDNLERIHKAARRAADLTRQLLAFARKQTVAPRVMDLNAAVENMLNMLRRLLGENIILQWLPRPDLWPVKMDPSQIDQVLANLCVNSHDAIADSGDLILETDNVNADEAFCAAHEGISPGHYVMLSVRDSGSGMDEMTLSHIFEPFFTTKAPGKGTGLGLATVYGIIKQNNGHIEVRSASGKGTDFRIYLPRSEERPETPKPEAEAGPGERGQASILLVEDEQIVLELASKSLRSLGYTVLPARTPGEALAIAMEHSGRINLLLSDVVMPEMNGRDLAKNLLALYPDIKVMFMSGYTADVIARQGVLEEGVRFLQKPFSLHDLANKVKETLIS